MIFPKSAPGNPVAAPDGSVQYNAGDGVFGGSAGFKFDPTNRTVLIAGPGALAVTNTDLVQLLIAIPDESTLYSLVVQNTTYSVDPDDGFALGQEDDGNSFIGVYDVGEGSGMSCSTNHVQLHSSGSVGVGIVAETVDDAADLPIGIRGSRILCSAPVRLEPRTFAALPDPPQVGDTVVISDSSTAVLGATIAGGGVNVVLAFYNAANNWVVVGV